MNLTLEEAKRRLPLTELAHRLEIASEIPEHDGRTVRCFWPDRHANGDRKPSFNFHKGLTQFKCFSCGMNGDGPDMVSLVLNVDRKEGIRRFLEMAGGETVTHQERPKERKPLTMPRDLTSGTEAEWRAVAELRRIETSAVLLAVGIRTLFFGTVKGFPSWILTDERRRVAEARRMDGKPYPAIGNLPERKAHTLAGSRKDWPVGIQCPYRSVEGMDVGCFMLVEGGPDYLAAHHFINQWGRIDILPVAMLGRNAGTIHTDSFRFFRSSHVRIYPHADPDGGGIEAARNWKRQIEEASASKVDAFDFSGLIRKDGKPVTDLNDCTVIRQQDESELEGLLP